MALIYAASSKTSWQLPSDVRLEGEQSDDRQNMIIVLETLISFPLSMIPARYRVIFN